MNAGVMKWIVPWEFSWVFLIVFVAVAAAYVAGTRRLHVAPLHQAAFWAGVAIVYVALHTYFDYYAEHEFFMHRIQQVLLHHLAPLLIIAAYPGTVLRAVPGNRGYGVSSPGVCSIRPLSRCSSSRLSWSGLFPTCRPWRCWTGASIAR